MRCSGLCSRVRACVCSRVLFERGVACVRAACVRVCSACVRACSSVCSRRAVRACVRRVCSSGV